MRPLLPKGNGNPPLRPPNSKPLPRLRSVIPLACESCRRSKIKCSGERPSCRPCSHNSRPCVYRAEAGMSSVASLKKQNLEAQEEIQQLRRSQKDLQRIISALQTRDDAEVATIVRHLRDAQDPEAVAKQLEGSDMLLQLHVRPDTKFCFTFPFPREMPHALRTPDNVSLESPLYESAFPAPDYSAAAAAPLVEVQQHPQFQAVRCGSDCRPSDQHR